MQIVVDLKVRLARCDRERSGDAVTGRTLKTRRTAPAVVVDKPHRLPTARNFMRFRRAMPIDK
jgi:hypothetical protein